MLHCIKNEQELSCESVWYCPFFLQFCRKKIWLSIVNFNSIRLLANIHFVGTRVHMFAGKTDQNFQNRKGDHLVYYYRMR